MSKPVWVLGSMLLVMALQVSAHSEEAPPPRMVSVNGQGEVSVLPDRARLSLSVDALNPDLKTAESQVNAIVRAYLAEAKALGTQDKDISTAGISISPEYVWNDKQNQQKLVGYRARRDIEVVVNNLDKLGDYLLRATKVGVNHVNPPALESSRSDELSRQALVKATVDARDKARLLAETLGMKLGPVRSLHANDASAPPPTPMFKVMAMRAEAASDTSGNDQMGFASGEIKYSATTSADFDLLER